MTRKILVISSDQTMEVPFEQQLTIGRDVYNSLSLQDTEISRSHAIIYEQGKRVIVKDLDSRNGVFVNGERIKAHVLEEGDEVVLGSTILFFCPPERLEVPKALSQRGRYIFKKGAAAPKPPETEPVTVFSTEQMEQVIDRLFDDSESTTFFTLGNAMALLKGFYEMGHGRGTEELFHAALDRAMDLLGGDHGVVMEADAGKEKLKVRSIVSTNENNSTIEISQQVLRVVLRAERCVFCPDAGVDSRFSRIARAGRRSVHSFIASPIVSGGSYFGFIYLHSENPEHEYDFVALRSLYLLASHLGALLQPHSTHFAHDAEAQEKAPAGALY